MKKLMKHIGIFLKDEEEEDEEEDKKDEVPEMLGRGARGAVIASKTRVRERVRGIK